MSGAELPPTAPAPRFQDFGRDVAVLTTVRLAAVGAGFLTSVLAARVLGTSELGAAGVALTIGSIAALVANGGLNIASTYFLGRRPHERQVIAHRVLTLGLVAALLAAVLVLVAVRPFADRIFGQDAQGLLSATAILAAGIVGFEVGGAILLGLDRRRPYVVTQIIEGIGSLVLTAAILWLVSATAQGMVIAAGLAFLLAALFSALVAQRTVGGWAFAFDARFTREALALGLRGQAGNILQFLNLRLDLLLVSLLMDLRAAGLYLIAVRMSEVVTQAASAAAAFLFPAVSRSGVNQTELTERTMRVTLIVVIAAGAAIALAGQVLLETFFGSQFGAATGALRITMLAMVPLSISRILAGDMKGRGRAGLVSISAAMALIATLLLDVLLIPRYGIEGAAVASLFAYSGGAATLLAAYARVTGAPLRRLIPRVADLATIASVVGRLIPGRRSRPLRP